MKSIDTNVLARYVIGDDPAQSDAATAILTQPCLVSNTVLLETAWLLSSRYQMNRKDIAATLSDLLCLPQLMVDDQDGVSWAIARFADGADFADMIHVVSARHTDAFVTFDRSIAGHAASDSPVAIETLA